MSGYTGRTDTGAPIERTGWRDEELKKYTETVIGGLMPNDDRAVSDWHRYAMSKECKAVDIDFMLLEHYEGNIVAAIEYKRMKPKKFSQNNNYKALSMLCDKAEIPFFMVFYKPDFSAWDVWPANRKTAEAFKHTEMTEKEYVDFCYKLRGVSTPPNITKKLERWEIERQEGTYWGYRY